MAIIEKFTRKGLKFLGANNLLISDPEVKTNSFILRYKSPSGSVSEKTYVPNDEGNKDHVKALHALWYAIWEKMKKAGLKDSINPFPIINSEPFRRKVRIKDEPQQMELDLKTARHVIELFRSLR